MEEIGLQLFFLESHNYWLCKFIRLQAKPVS